MRPPHYFFWGNLVLRTPTEAWAVYELEGQSYPGLSDSRKIEVGERLEALAYTLEADFQILRDRPRLRRRGLRAPGARDARPSPRPAPSALRPTSPNTAPSSSAAALCARRSTSPSALARPAAPARSAACSTAPPRSGGLRRAGSAIEEARGLGARQIAALRREEEAAFERVLGYLECSRVGPQRLAG